MKVRDVLKPIAEDCGHSEVRQAVTDSLCIRQSPAKVTVPGHSSIEVPPGTLSSILKQAGLKK
jgi:predicted RNA binding protein YcfA (HicA-like mRNA interferase family)